MCVCIFICCLPPHSFALNLCKSELLYRCHYCGVLNKKTLCCYKIISSFIAKVF